MTGIVARELDDVTSSAAALLLPIHCHACGHPGLAQRSVGDDGGHRRTWTGRCPDCRAEAVLVIDYVAIQPNGREFGESTGQGP